MVRRILLVLFAITIAHMASAQETTEEVGAILFAPDSNIFVIPGVQIYPVIVIHEAERPRDVPEAYLSIYFRDCSRQYFRVRAQIMQVVSADKKRKARFIAEYMENDGAFAIPLAPGIDENNLNPEGRATLRTPGTSILAKLQDTNFGSRSIGTFRQEKVLYFALDLSIEKQKDKPSHIRHVFELQPQNTTMNVIRYGGHHPPLTHTVIVPELPRECRVTE